MLISFLLVSAKHLWYLRNALIMDEKICGIFNIFSKYSQFSTIFCPKISAPQPPFKSVCLYV